MFKILRKSWKGRDSTQRSHSPAPSQEVDTSPENHSDAESTASDMDGISASLIPTSSRTKRSRDVFEPEVEQTFDIDRPSKVPKTDEPDYLRNHLPEILDTTERDEISNRLSLESRREQILLRLQNENGNANYSRYTTSLLTNFPVIAVLSSTKGALFLYFYPHTLICCFCSLRQSIGRRSRLCP